VLFTRFLSFWQGMGSSFQATLPLVPLSTTPCGPPYSTSPFFVTPADGLTSKLALVGASQAPSGVVVVSSAGLVVSGNLILSPSTTMQVASGGVVSVAGVLVIQPGSTLQLTGVKQGTVQVMSYYQVEGNFSAITATSDNGCPATVTPDYGSSTLSVTVTVTCASGGLSTGAIVGIAVGAAVAGILVIVLMALLVRHLVKARDVKANKEIAIAQLQ
jgi:hypothetical protein